MATHQDTQTDDRVAGSAAANSPGLDGDWASVTRLSHGVSRIRTSRTDEGFIVHAYGGGEPRPGAWGETPADGVFALRSGAGYAFMATFEGPATITHLQTNLVHGVMGVHAFHRFTDGSGRRDYYTREFFVPAIGGRSDDQGGAEQGFPPALLTGANSPDSLLGHWSVLDPANMNISALDLELADGKLTVLAFGADPNQPVDWAATATHLYADAAKPEGPPAFLATFDLGDRRVHLQARDYNGILVGAQYIEFTDDSGRSDYFTRDCFRQ
ncbi:MAG TPA: hypothetical protein VH912_07360 [Streptosporangiaceae bacterium]|jgi:hypothetical protein